jgi:hypothetical protein
MGLKYGSRIWYGVICIAWGIVAIFAAMVRDATGLYWQRAALGLTGAA